MAYGYIGVNHLRLIESQLQLEYGVAFVVEHEHMSNKLLVSWKNMHGDIQRYELEADPVGSGHLGCKIKPASLKGLIALVKMTT